MIVFAHKTTEAWETIISSLLEAGLYMRASWPVHTEMGSRLREELEKVLPKRLAELRQRGISGADFSMAAIASVREKLTPKLEELWRQGLYPDFVEIIHTQEEARQPRWYYLDMTEDAIILLDKDGFFAGVLDSLRSKLRSLGAQRKKLGKSRYWDLKPDFRPGETIEL